MKVDLWVSTTLSEQMAKSDGARGIALLILSKKKKHLEFRHLHVERTCESRARLCRHWTNDYKIYFAKMLRGLNNMQVMAQSLTNKLSLIY